ncbi:DUF6527 family protein [Polaribacter glomeratus]|uniref:Uncharacterized protein n=1 Tax=Polaribacter glomeratus TaxID=102 RepID=A0A2S7WG03_9FLAO|nr:DUF6527 family protein [Polaribacter glomeratus]PQJ76549.1 hypothetical protein BTO16_11655 [Polaribacter glomeratus]TXD67615.1 hypothetical protein ESX12_03255 [Polaribacter glomeratus]
MLLKKTFNWLKSFVFGKSRKQKPKYIYKIVKELPFSPKNNVFYIEGDEKNNDYWYALMICPCGCKQKLTLNLIDDVRPCWSVNFENNIVSVSPSIWRTKNCKSHFWLKRGIVDWV